MFGIECRVCNKNKLWSEFAHETLFESCNHAPLVCLRCMANKVKQHRKCPYPGCSSLSDETALNKAMDSCEKRLNHMFGTKPPQHKPSDMTKSPYIWVMSITGEKIKINYDKNKTIEDLKQEIKDEMNKIKPLSEESSLRLSCHGRELNSIETTSDGAKVWRTLVSCEIKAGDIIHVQVVLNTISSDLRYVTFNISWSFTGHSKEFYAIRDAELKSGYDRVQAILTEREESFKKAQAKPSKSTKTWKPLDPSETKEFDTRTFIAEYKALRKSRDDLAKLKDNYKKTDLYTEYLDGVCFVYDGKELSVVDRKRITYDTPQGPAIEHSGDTTDDTRKIVCQTLKIHFIRLPKEVTHLVFVVSAFGTEAEAKTLSMFRKVEMSFESVDPLVSDCIDQAKSFPAVVLCVLRRKDTMWQVIPSGMPCAGSTANYEPLKESVKHIIMSNCL